MCIRFLNGMWRNPIVSWVWEPEYIYFFFFNSCGSIIRRFSLLDLISFSVYFGSLDFDLLVLMWLYRTGHEAFWLPCSARYDSRCFCLKDCFGLYVTWVWLQVGSQGPRGVSICYFWQVQSHKCWLFAVTKVELRSVKISFLILLILWEWNTI